MVFYPLIDNSGCTVNSIRANLELYDNVQCLGHPLLKWILSVDMQASIVILAPIIPCVQHTFYSGYGNTFSIRRILRVSLHRKQCAWDCSLPPQSWISNLDRVNNMPVTRSCSSLAHSKVLILLWKFWELWHWQYSAVWDARVWGCTHAVFFTHSLELMRSMEVVCHLYPERR